jgi:hypothetical protein
MALDLGKQVGPLPLGAWIVVVGGGLGIAYWTKQNQTAPEPSIDTSGTPGVGDGSVGGWVPTSPSTGSSTGAPDPTTNEEWAYKAKQVLIASGYPTTQVEAAINKYINGEQLSVQEFAIVAVAISKVGPLPATMPNTPSQPATPVQHGRGYGWYKAVAGDNITKIAQKADISTTTFILYNGPAAIKAGKWYKIRAASEPLYYYNGK